MFENVKWVPHVSPLLRDMGFGVRDLGHPPLLPCSSLSRFSAEERTTEGWP
jgi:hypothetical protein